MTEPNARVFISWSKEPARAIALALVELIKVCADGPAPFMSSQMDSGVRPMNTIADELDNTRYAIAIVTRENVEQPWLQYEVGALGREVGQPATTDDRLVPLLFQMSTADIPNGNPLSLFQAAQAADREDVLGILRAIASLRGGPDVPTLEKRFGHAWDDFTSVLEELESRSRHPSAPPAPRPAQALLEEIHEDVRELVRAARTPAPPPIKRRADSEDSVLTRTVRRGFLEHGVILDSNDVLFTSGNPPKVTVLIPDAHWPLPDGVIERVSDLVGTYFDRLIEIQVAPR